MLVTFWGVRGSIPTPGESTARYGGNTPCVTIEHKDTLLIIDCGSGLRVLGNALLQKSKGQPIEADILISHTHWDHIQGFPFFIPAFIPNNTFKIYGAEGVSLQIEETLAGQMESPYFPVTLDEMRASISFVHINEPEFTIGEFKVISTLLNHPGVALGYRISTEEGEVVYYSDHEPYHRLLMTPSPFKQDVCPDISDDDKTQYAQIRDKEYVDFCKGADLLIEDSSYTAEEYKTKAGFGHACVDDVITMAVEGQVKQLALFHHDPIHTDEQIDQMVEYCQTDLIPSDSTLQCFGAREGLQISIGQSVREAV